MSEIFTSHDFKLRMFNYLDLKMMIFLVKYYLILFSQKTGKTVIKYLKKRKMTGDDLRREMWVHDEASTPKAKKGKKKAKGYDVS